MLGANEEWQQVNRTNYPPVFHGKEGLTTTGIDASRWNLVHEFIRFWRNRQVVSNQYGKCGRAARN
jgi:hypothetical protein